MPQCTILNPRKLIEVISHALLAYVWRSTLKRVYDSVDINTPQAKSLLFFMNYEEEAEYGAGLAIQSFIQLISCPLLGWFGSKAHIAASGRDRIFAHNI